MKLSIIIPNYNSANTILRTLKSILSQDVSISELIVVDDCSKDKSLEIITKNYPKVKIYKNKKNSGAGFTRNVGIRKAKGDILLFIDSDVYMGGNVIKKLLLESKNADIVFPKMIYENKRSMYPNRKQDEEYLLISPIFMMTKSSLDKLHNSYFDQAYTGYCEDTDFFLKCKLLGLTCKYIASAVAVHVVNKPKNREDRYYSEIVSTYYGAIKYFGFKELKGLDHAFSIGNIIKLYVLGVFNFKLFDAQINNFNKGGSTLYKLKYLLTNKEKITDKGRAYLIVITIKGIIVALTQTKKALRARKQIIQQIHSKK